MAKIKLGNLLLLLFTIILATYVTQGSRTQVLFPYHQRTPSSLGGSRFQGSYNDQEQMSSDSKRSMIGSTAPTCTYNECRGCKYKCRAEQVPVEGNDPINSAYHYRCVCHR